MFYSCNGLSHEVTDSIKEKVGGVEPLWLDFAKKHETTPYHVMIGGGDQVCSCFLIW
jgi:hypothetical protein